MKLDGAPGPYGYNVRFYRKFWDIVKLDVQAMLNSFFQSANMDPILNKSYITLIPKVTGPQNFKDFRPISLANVSYKLASKVLCNRLKSFLLDIIAPNQSAFLKGRLISDNILLATEVMHKIRSTRTGKKGWCALKLDIHKAYDKLSWNFIEAVLTCMSFPAIWISYIKHCITSQEEAKLWKGIKVGRNAVPLTHLMYADDTLLFFEANDHNLRAVNSVLVEYAELAGQSMNVQKSFLVFSPNIRHNSKKEMANFFNLKFHSTLGKYLGTYVESKESKSHVIQDTINKIESKLQIWKSKLLSQAARFTLIKSVINSYLVYPLSCMQFPKDKCRKIESLMSNFFWGHNGSVPKLHLHNWNHLCKPKNMGGLALCNFSTFNEALLAKQVWRTLNNNNSLASLTLSSKYLNDDGNIIVPSNASWRWKAIFRSKEVVLSNLEWQIGDGKCIKINHHAWWPMLRDQQLISSVADLIKNNGSWNTPIINRLYDANTAATIANTPLSVTGIKDKLMWTGTSDGQYRVKDAYNWIIDKRELHDHSNSSTVPPPNICPIWKIIWKFKLPFRIIMFLWRVLNNNLPACSVLIRHDMVLEDICINCGEKGESLNHIFLQCNFAKVVWFGTHLSYKPPDSDISLLQWFNDCYMSFKQEEQYILSFMAVVLHVLWRCRNLRVMEGKQVEPYSAISMIYSTWNSCAQSFSNYQMAGNQVSSLPKHDNWTTIDSLPLSGITIVSATHRSGNERRIYIQVLGNREILFHAVYALRRLEDFKVANLMVIRRGIQVAINTSTIRTCCNLVVLQKSTADLLQTGYKANRRLQLLGSDIRNLLLTYRSSDVSFLRSISFRKNFITKSPSHGFMLGWSIL
ncbi:ribonuclease H [Senna tora]|uniref:Ribonuclease H n=1 Tax=Senna tora TaxID=362788 RepID=A0A834WRY1_9FABA|nr:ribonuclease H [Senna tora]